MCLLCDLVARTDAARLRARGSCLAPALSAPRGLLPPRRVNGQVVEIEQVRANALPIPTLCASPTVALTPGTDPALGRLRSPCLELAGKFFFVICCFARRRVPRARNRGYYVGHSRNALRAAFLLRARNRSITCLLRVYYVRHVMHYVGT